MAQVTRTFIASDGNTLTAAIWNAEFNNLLNNLQIVNADISSSASIATSKINLGSAAQGGVLYDSGSQTILELAAGTAGKFLQTQGTGANPVWANAITDSSTTTLTNSSTTSTTDVTLISQSITVAATSDVLVLFNGIWQQSNSSGHNYLDVQLDSSVQGNNPMAQMDATAAGQYLPVSVHSLISSVSSGTHTISIGFRVASGTTTCTFLSGNLIVLIL